LLMDDLLLLLLLEFLWHDWNWYVGLRYLHSVSALKLLFELLVDIA